jgi:hypothetical protein
MSDTVWMMPLFRNFSRNVMDCDDPVKDHDHNENKQADTDEKLDSLNCHRQSRSSA